MDRLTCLWTVTLARFGDPIKTLRQTKQGCGIVRLMMGRRQIVKACVIEVVATVGGRYQGCGVAEEPALFMLGLASLPQTKKLLLLLGFNDFQLLVLPWRTSFPSHPLPQGLLKMKPIKPSGKPLAEGCLARGLCTNNRNL